MVTDTAADVYVVTSCLRRAPGPKNEWRIDAERSFLLPVIVEHRGVERDSDVLAWLIEAYVDVRHGEPALIRVDTRVPDGIDVVDMQRAFIWASPLDIVRRGVPELLSRGIDPMGYALPVTGFPEAAGLVSRPGSGLSDDFLEDVARRYLVIGRGYAREMAGDYGVSPRTVVSWVEKARRRGILTRTRPGQRGGEILPRRGNVNSRRAKAQ